MEGPSNLRHNRGHAKEIHTNGSNIYTAKNNLVFKNRISIYSFTKHLMSSYCVHSPAWGAGKPWCVRKEKIPTSSSLQWGRKEQHNIRLRRVQTNVKLELREMLVGERKCNETQASVIRSTQAGQGISLKKGCLNQDLKAGPKVCQVMSGPIKYEVSPMRNTIQPYEGMKNCFVPQHG